VTVTRTGSARRPVTVRELRSCRSDDPDRPERRRPIAPAGTLIVANSLRAGLCAVPGGQAHCIDQHPVDFDGGTAVARSVQVHLLDDLDGSTADETVTFAVDGISYDIDLSTAHASDLRGALKPFTAAARRMPRGGVAPVTRGMAGRSDRRQNAAIREWAARNNIELSSRGRIPSSIIARYEAQVGR
jgi:hypothetical protein